MRVNQSGSHPAQETKQSKQPKQIKSSENKHDPGSVQKKQNHSAENSAISARGKEFARVKEAASQAPDVREDRIAELKKRISEGKYKVDADKIAERLVDDHLKTAGLLGES